MHPVAEYLPPIRITIPGKFWDSQLYSGTLYLFGLSGELQTISWDKLVAGLPVPANLRIAADLALLGNHRLYEPGACLLLRDPDIRELLEGKFRQLGAMPPWEFVLDNEGAEDNPLPFPHNDSEIHYHHLYVGTSDGLYGLTAGGKDKVQLSETPALHIAARLSTMAQAAGSEGLYGVRLATDSDAVTGDSRSHEIQVSKLPCATCEWAFASVIAAGYDNSVYVAPFNRVDPLGNERGRRSKDRQFDRIILEPDIFKGDSAEHRGFTWGAGDKIFRFSEGRVGVTKYTPHAKKPPTFTFKGDIPLEDPETGASVVAARAASFGSVIEKDDALLVMLSTGDSLSLVGEPTNWRVFPRSKNYINHLHVIYGDRLEIWAFTHDYFVDQESKLSGIGASTSD